MPLKVPYCIGLLAELETKLVAPFKPEYNQLLENARKRLAGKQDDLGVEAMKVVHSRKC